jgi:TetR/AcrR family transcriptional repressor of mexCD-oprJ operon
MPSTVKPAMPPKVDHRRAIAERNAAGILDALERLGERGAAVNMAAIAAEAGVSRPTLYAHYKTLGDVVEAAVERTVLASMAAFEAARPSEGPAGAALERMLEASWGQLAKFRGLVRVALEHMPAWSVHRTHHAMLAPLAQLIERGRREGTIRTDLPAAWLQTMYFQLVHGAEEHAATYGTSRDETLELLKTSARDVFSPRPADGH